MVLKYIEDDSNVCFNCIHKWSYLCILYDDLIEDNGSCFMFHSRKNNQDR